MVHVFSEHLSPVEESAGNNTTEGRNDLANSSTTFNTSQQACVSLTWFHSVANNFSQLRFAMHFLPFGPVKERRPAGSKLQACVKRDHAWRAICAQTDAEQPGRWRAGIDPELGQ